VSRRNRNGSSNNRDGVYDAWKNNGARNRYGSEELMWLRVFEEMAIARFKWKGLPDTVSPRFLEKTLFEQGLAVFFKSRQYDQFMAVRGTPSGEWNAYDDPTSFRVYGNTELVGTTELAYGRAKKDCVPIWANTLRQPDWDIAMLYATRIAKLERTVEINLQALRKPFVFAVDESERQTFLQLWRQVEEGQPVVFGARGMSAQSIRDKVHLFDMKMSDQLPLNLQRIKREIWNECMTLLGINNSNQDKRERLVADEVSANNEQVAMARNIAMEARLQACDEINKLYPELEEEVTVEWNTDDLLAPDGQPEWGANRDGSSVGGAAENNGGGGNGGGNA